MHILNLRVNHPSKLGTIGGFHMETREIYSLEEIESGQAPKNVNFEHLLGNDLFKKISKNRHLLLQVVEAAQIYGPVTFFNDYHIAFKDGNVMLLGKRRREEQMTY